MSGAGNAEAGGRGGRFAGRRVLAVGTFDSFIRTAAIIGRMFEAEGAVLEIAALAVASEADQLSSRQLQDSGVPAVIPRFTAQALVASTSFREADLLVAVIDGGRAREVFLAMQESASRGRTSRPIVVIASPGLALTEQITGFMSRAPADVLCFNARPEADLYRAAAAEIGLDASNAVVTGLLGLDRSPRKPATARPLIAFFEQPVIPARRVQRAHLVAGLIELARREPGADIVIKLRHGRNETAHHATRHHLEDLAEELFERGGRPANFSFTHESAGELLGRAALVLTVSSTVAVEAMARGVPTRIVSDFGIAEALGVDFFVGSGCLAPLAAIGPDMSETVDADWLERRSGAAVDPETMLSRCAGLLAERDRAGASWPLRPLSPAYGSPAWIGHAMSAHGPVALHAPHLLERGGIGRRVFGAFAALLRTIRRNPRRG